MPERKKEYQCKMSLYVIYSHLSCIWSWDYLTSKIPSRGSEISSWRYSLFSLIRVTDDNSSCKLCSSVVGPKAFKKASLGFQIYFLSFESKLLKVVLLLRSLKISLGSYHRKFSVWSEVNSFCDGSIFGNAVMSILKNTLKVKDLHYSFIINLWKWYFIR